MRRAHGAAAGSDDGSGFAPSASPWAARGADSTDSGSGDDDRQHDQHFSGKDGTFGGVHRVLLVDHGMSGAALGGGVDTDLHPALDGIGLKTLAYGSTLFIRDSSKRLG